MYYPVLGSGDTTVNKTDKLTVLRGFIFQLREGEAAETKQGILVYQMVVRALK